MCRSAKVVCTACPLDCAVVGPSPLLTGPVHRSPSATLDCSVVCHPPRLNTLLCVASPSPTLNYAAAGHFPYASLDCAAVLRSYISTEQLMPIPLYRWFRCVARQVWYWHFVNHDQILGICLYCISNRSSNRQFLISFLSYTGIR